MLVLSQKPGQKVVIPEIGMEVHVVEVKRNGTVRLGFQAPRNITILRDKLIDNPNPPAK